MDDRHAKHSFLASGSGYLGVTSSPAGVEVGFSDDASVGILSRICWHTSRCDLRDWYQDIKRYAPTMMPTTATKIKTSSTLESEKVAVTRAQIAEKAMENRKIAKFN